jgi:hypothetical protein
VKNRTLTGAESRGGQELTSRCINLPFTFSDLAGRMVYCRTFVTSIIEDDEAFHHQGIDDGVFSFLCQGIGIEDASTDFSRQSTRFPFRHIRNFM